MCFNSRTPKGCDFQLLLTFFQDIQVSIHAPLKGATSLGSDEISTLLVSIHAPLKGATQAWQLIDAQNWSVSIHAPLKGATLLLRSLSYFDAFQFTHP